MGTSMYYEKFSLFFNQFEGKTHIRFDEDEQNVKEIALAIPSKSVSYSTLLLCSIHRYPYPCVTNDC